MDLRQIDWGCVEWIQLAQDSLVAGCCECGDEVLGSSATELVSHAIVIPGCFPHYENNYSCG
jgi:hypothetical protein